MVEIDKGSTGSDPKIHFGNIASDTTFGGKVNRESWGCKRFSLLESRNFYVYESMNKMKE